MRPRLLPEKATPEVAFSFLLNRLLAPEAWARQRLAPFAGETVELRAAPLPTLRLRILEGGTVEAGSAEAGLTMTLKPELLVALARGEEHALRSVDVQGNAALAAEILVLARHLRWDVEEELSQVFGDVVAHRLTGAVRAFAAWHLDAAQRVTGALVDYATEEKKVLVRRAEFEALAEPLARLRDAIARLDKRLERLE
ncbi:MAG TPA: SCP2 sterol-binding domain-containing protein [Burkholderiales bacterium]|nr:SCP2 sterol-binding domain-containing protein [Burkholderiales bacterium]